MEDGHSQMYIDLGKLLAKKRTVSRQRAVEEVLDKGIPLHQKIAEIEKIDRNIPGNSSHRFQEETSTETIEVITGCEDPESSECIDKTALRNRTRIKSRLTRSPLFMFLFKELFAILKNSTKNSVYATVRLKIFPFSLRVNHELHQHITDNYIQSASDLLKILNPVLESGWQYISKTEYNLLVLFRDMCRKLSGLNSRAFLAAKPFNSEKFRTFEQLFLTCCYDEYYPTLIFQSLQTVAAKTPDIGEHKLQLQLMLARRVLLRVLKPSMHEILTAVNSVWFRKNIDFASLYTNISLPVIPTQDFNCTPEVRTAINIFIEQQKKRIIELENDHSAIVRYEEHLSNLPDGNYDYTLLRHCYELVNKSSGYEEAEKYPLIFIIKIAQMFPALFGRVMTGEISTDKRTSFRVFAPDLFQLETLRLQSFIEKLNRLHYVHRNIDQERYNHLRISLKSGTEPEIESMQLINDIIETFFSIAEKIVTIERYHTEGAEKAVDISMLSAKKLTVPGYNERINHLHLQGQSIQQVIRDMASVALLTCIAMKDSRISSMLSQKERVGKELEAAKSAFVRLAPANTASDFFTAFNILPPQQIQSREI